MWPSNVAPDMALKSDSAAGMWLPNLTPPQQNGMAWHGTGWDEIAWGRPYHEYTVPWDNPTEIP